MQTQEVKGYTIKNQQALHYVTFTVEGWIDVFSRQKYRDIFLDSLRYCQKEQGLMVYAYVIMSNHVHLIVRSETGNLSKTIHNCRKFTANQIIKAIQEPGEVVKSGLCTYLVTLPNSKRTSSIISFGREVFILSNYLLTVGFVKNSTTSTKILFARDLLHNLNITFTVAQATMKMIQVFLR